MRVAILAQVSHSKRWTVGNLLLLIKPTVEPTTIFSSTMLTDIRSTYCTWWKGFYEEKIIIGGLAKNIQHVRTHLYTRWTLLPIGIAYECVFIVDFQENWKILSLWIPFCSNTKEYMSCLDLGGVFCIDCFHFRCYLLHHLLKKSGSAVWPENMILYQKLPSFQLSCENTVLRDRPAPWSPIVL